MVGFLFFFFIGKEAFKNRLIQGNTVLPTKAVIFATYVALIVSHQFVDKYHPVKFCTILFVMANMV